MKSPKLTQETKSLAAQIESWSHIVSLSDRLAKSAAKRDWDRVLIMAEERDIRVTAFFEQEICYSIFPMVSEALVLMKQQHEQILRELKQSQLRNIEKENFLLGIRDQLSQPGSSLM